MHDKIAVSLPLRLLCAFAGGLLLTAQVAASDVMLVPANGSSLSGDQGGFTLSKCGSDKVSVVGVDDLGNLLVGASSPVPELTSDSALLRVVGPSGSAPNLFTLVRPIGNPPKAGAIVHLTASMLPPPNSGEDPVSNTIPMTFNSDICGVITEFSIPTSGSDPRGIATGPDGNLWFTEFNGDRVGTIATDGTVREFSAGISPASEPRGIALGPDHRLWFTECATGKIGRVTTAGAIEEFAAAASAPYGITAGSDDNLWFSESGSGKIGHMTTAGTMAHRYAPKTAGAQPHGIAAGPDGNLWVAECAGNKIAMVSTDGDITEFPVPTPKSCPEGIAAGPDDNLWFTEYAANKIGRITTAGAIAEYALQPGRGPRGIVAGADGNVWFAESSGHRIGQIGTDGKIVEFSAGLDGASEPYDLTTGGDGSIWFTDVGTGKIGRLQ